MGGGLAVACRHVLASGIIAVYLVVTLTAAIRQEEAFLREAFGDGYERYRRGGESESKRFSLAQAIANREYRAVAGLVGVMLLLVWKATYNGSF